MNRTLRSVPPQSSPSDSRLERFQLQNVARSFLCRPGCGEVMWRRLAGCNRWTRPRPESDSRSVDVLLHLESNRAHYAGLQQCGSSWVCPVCSGRIYDRRRLEVAQALEWARESHSVLFITLTCRHTSADDLVTQLGSMEEALRSMYSGRSWQRFRARTGYVGSVRGTEITHGVNGWHTHHHLLWICAEGVTAADVCAEIDGLWSRSLDRHALSGLPGIRCVVKDSDLSAAAYIAKFEKERRWDVDAELTMWNRKAGGCGPGRSPWDLLRAGESVLFEEYATATWGRHALQFSRGLRAAAGLTIATDDEIVAGDVAEGPMELIMSLGVVAWRVVVANDLRGELLVIAARDGSAGVSALLDSLGYSVYEDSA